MAAGVTVLTEHPWFSLTSAVRHLAAIARHRACTRRTTLAPARRAADEGDLRRRSPRSYPPLGPRARRACRPAPLAPPLRHRSRGRLRGRTVPATSPKPGLGDRRRPVPAPRLLNADDRPEFQARANAAHTPLEDDAGIPARRLPALRQQEHCAEGSRQISGWA